MRALFALSLLAVFSLVACDRLDPRHPAEAVTVDPDQVAAEGEAVSDDPPQPDGDAGVPQGDVWPPGPGPGEANVAVTDGPDEPSGDAGVPQGDVWPPGPGPGEANVAVTDGPDEPSGDAGVPQGDVWPPGPGPGEANGATSGGTAPVASAQGTGSTAWQPRR